MNGLAASLDGLLAQRAGAIEVADLCGEIGGRNFFKAAESIVLIGLGGEGCG